MKPKTRAALAPDRPPLRVYDPTMLTEQTPRWCINGFPARLVVWTLEEWEKLEQQPADAQFVACGLWCALRMD